MTHIKFKKFLLVILLMFAVTFGFSQAMGPSEPPGGGPGVDDTPVGGDAPIGAGVGILLALGAAYGGLKIYKHFQEDLEELEA